MFVFAAYCFFYLGKREICARERERARKERKKEISYAQEKSRKKKKLLFLIDCKNGVLIFKQYVTKQNHVQVMCY